MQAHPPLYNSLQQHLWDSSSKVHSSDSSSSSRRHQSRAKLQKLEGQLPWRQLQQELAAQALGRHRGFLPQNRRRLSLPQVIQQARFKCQREPVIGNACMSTAITYTVSCIPLLPHLKICHALLSSPSAITCTILLHRWFPRRVGSW